MMEIDIFSREQNILDDALENAQSESNEFGIIAKEYGRLLRQLRLVTKNSDKATYVSFTAKDRAEAAAEARASFLASMSHEIRTPMNGVIGLTDLALDDEELTEKQRGYLIKIKRSADGLLSIINNILDISKIDAGAITLENIPFDLREVFSECYTVITHKAEEKGITLHFHNETDFAYKLIGDPTRLRQVLLNLLSNAVKFTNSGTVTMEAKCVNPYDGAGVMVSFCVTDSGIGMTPEQCEKIFCPFEQADDSTTRNYGGTGLGLSITKTFIEMMGGEVHIESIPEVGSRFYFSVAFELSDEKCTPIDEQTKYNPHAGRPTFTGKVLLCEDNETNQLVSSENLKKLGLTVTIAGNGKIGVEAVRNAKTPFDIIFMDMRMPIMDGMQATRELISQGVKTPIIAMTANAMKEAREECLIAGMTDYITKPFKPSDLWACLAKYLEPADALTVANDEADVAIDKATGLLYVGEDEEMYHKLLTRVLDEQPKMLSELEAAIEDGEYLLAHGIAHQMKGIATTLGATKLPELFARIEQTLRTGTADGYHQEMLYQCKQEFEKVLIEIEADIKGGNQ